MADLSGAIVLSSVLGFGVGLISGIFVFGVAHKLFIKVRVKLMERKLIRLMKEDSSND